MRGNMKSLVIAAVVAGTLFTTGAGIAGDRRSSPGTETKSGDEIVCRRFLRTGTLSGYDRVCKSRDDWQRERDNLRSMNGGESCRNDGLRGLVCG